MNLILLFQHEIDNNQHTTLTDRRAQHICKIIKPQIGQSLNIGIVDGGIGKAEVLDISSTEVTLGLTGIPTQTPPKQLDISLFIALPRPKVARRIIQLCSECGVKELHFINSYRVEKSFWQSPLLSQEKIAQQLLLGLEQSKDTIIPTVSMHKRFKPFVEDQLSELIKNKTALLAHPYHATINFDKDLEQLDALRKQALAIVIGPEGGFIPYEIELLQSMGLTTLGIDERIYRVETVIPLLIGKLS